MYDVSSVYLDGRRLLNARTNECTYAPTSICGSLTPDALCVWAVNERPRFLWSDGTLVALADVSTPCRSDARVIEAAGNILVFAPDGTPIAYSGMFREDGSRMRLNGASRNTFDGAFVAWDGQLFYLCEFCDERDFRIIGSGLSRAGQATATRRSGPRPRAGRPTRRASCTYARPSPSST